MAENTDEVEGGAITGPPPDAVVLLEARMPPPCLPPLLWRPRRPRHPPEPLYIVFSTSTPMAQPPLLSSRPLESDYPSAGSSLWPSPCWTAPCQQDFFFIQDGLGMYRVHTPALNRGIGSNETLSSAHSAIECWPLTHIHLLVLPTRLAQNQLLVYHDRLSSIILKSLYHKFSL